LFLIGWLPHPNPNKLAVAANCPWIWKMSGKKFEPLHFHDPFKAAILMKQVFTFSLSDGARETVFLIMEVLQCRPFQIWHYGETATTAGGGGCGGAVGGDRHTTITTTTCSSYYLHHHNMYLTPSPQP
jgi:hypothetical protein